MPFCRAREGQWNKMRRDMPALYDNTQHSSSYYCQFFDQLAFFSTDTHSYTCTRISFQLSTSYSVKVLQKICNKESLFLYARNHFKCSYTCIITAYYDLWLDIHTNWPSLAERLLHKTLKELTNDLNYYSNKNTHTRLFNGPFSGTTWVSRYQKGNTNLDFTEAKRQWLAVESAGLYASLHLAPDR